MESYTGVLYDKLDAMCLVEAAKNDLVPIIPERFSEEERNTCAKSGAIYIWCENKSNIKRWTDGRKWSASRVSGVFLSYKEMIKPKKGCSSHATDLKSNGLTKLSFSFTDNLDKYHIVSYINENDSDKFQRPSEDKKFIHLDIHDRPDCVCQKRKLVDTGFNDSYSSSSSISFKRNCSTSSISSYSPPHSPSSPISHHIDHMQERLPSFNQILQNIDIGSECSSPIRKLPNYKRCEVLFVLDNKFVSNIGLKPLQIKSLID